MLHIIQKTTKIKKLKLLKFGIMKKENTTFKLKSQVKTNL